MHAISNMVDIWGAKVHKLATYYGASNLAGGLDAWVFVCEFTFTKLLSVVMPPCHRASRNECFQ